MPRVVSALMFFPRGGSATVSRALARRLPDHGWDVTLLSGSVPGHGDADRFYRGLDVRAVPFAPGGHTPMHPSYEEREDAPDVVFAAVDDARCEAHVAAWAEHLEALGAAEADVLHLHHLTPINEAAARVAPDVPVVGHLHGTELLMLEEIEAGPPASWRHAEQWAERMRAWAHRCERLVVLSDSQLDRVQRMLGISASRCVVVPNGVDLEHFRRRDVERPDHPVVIYVGRFTKVKRLNLLIRAWARVRETLPRAASLVIVGGHPGEWEGEHPAAVIEATGARDVHLAGWQPHERLPEFLSAADVLALPSVREQFGAVIVEAMACGVPPIAVDRYGPAGIVDDGVTGWLVEPDDEESLAAALAHAVGDPAECRRRGAAARRVAEERYGWDSIAERFAGVLEGVRAGRPATRR